jgi:pyruvate dehydrogenase E2 component (dihydrolipoamide acetyltransferase)
MARDFKLPELGENIASAKVVAVLVSAGDDVAKDQGLIEVETDKATVEVPSPQAGRIGKVHVAEGDTVEVGAALVSFAEDGEEAREPGAPSGAPEEAPEGEEERKPRTKERRAAPSKERGEARRKPAREERREAEPEEAEEEDRGEAERGEPEAEAQEADEEERSEAEAGEDAQADGEERRGKPAAARRERTPAAGLDEAEEASGVGPVEGRAAGRSIVAAPSVRHFAREIGVAIERVEGSGPGGRISIADVKEHARRARQAPAEAAAEPLGDLARWGEVEREPLSSVRRTIARRMSQSWRTAPHVTLDAEADVTEIEAVRQRYKARAQELGGNLTITAVLLKIAAAGLQRFPRANASLDAEEGSLVLRKYVNIGVAVDTERGLLVPVVRDADQKTILELSVELAELAERARKGKLRPDDMQGGGFTLTNLGSLGVATFTPILNPPEAAVLGIGRARLRPVYVEGELRPRLVLPLSLSFDHRVLDGADGARLLGFVVEALESPLSLAMGG